MNYFYCSSIDGEIPCFDVLHLQFSDISAKAATQGISPYTGQWEDIDTNMRWLPKTYAVFVISLPLSPSLSLSALTQKYLHTQTSLENIHKNILCARSHAFIPHNSRRLFGANAFFSFSCNCNLPSRSF